MKNLMSMDNRDKKMVYVRDKNTNLEKLANNVEEHHPLKI